MRDVAGQRLFQGFVTYRVPGSPDTHISNVLMGAFSRGEAIGDVVAAVLKGCPDATILSHRIEQIPDQMILDAYEHLAFTPDGKRQVRFGSEEPAPC